MHKYKKHGNVRPSNYSGGRDGLIVPKVKVFWFEISKSTPEKKQKALLKWLLKTVRDFYYPQ